MDMGSNEPVEPAHTDPPNNTPSGSLERIPGRCGAKIRNSNPPKYCQRHPLKDRERCRLHGGKTPRGFQSPHYRGRGYSKDLPPRLLERMLDGLDDPNLTSLRSEIALLDARMGELLEGLSENSSVDAWSAVADISTRLRYLVDRPDLDGRETRLETLCSALAEIIANESNNRDTWREVYQLVDRRRRTANVELKREELEELTLRHSQALHFFQMLIAVVHEEVDDVALKQRLATRLTERMGPGAGALPARTTVSD